MTKICVTIDGPASAGKSTAASLLAERVKYKYIDTGAMYRAVTLLALYTETDWYDEKALARLIEEHNIKQIGKTTLIDNKNVNSEIRSSEVSKAVSLVCKHEKVRTALVSHQRNLASKKGVVMEGRDVGTVVLPNAELKIYLTSNESSRARRRLIQIAEKNDSNTTSIDDVIENIRFRDMLDSKREIAPLAIPTDAIYIDNTYMLIDCEINLLEKLVKWKESI